MIITLGGTPGSGKSTVGRILAERLGYEFLSMGSIRREFAKKNGMTLEELNEQAKHDPESDNLVDEYLKELSQKDELIIDARLGWHFIPESFKVWITASEEERAKRIFNHDREEEKFASEQHILKRNKERLEEDRERYLKLYGIDYTKPENYDFVIDTTSISAEEAANIILDEVRKDLKSHD